MSDLLRKARERRLRALEAVSMINGILRADTDDIPDAETVPLDDPYGLLFEPARNRHRAAERTSDLLE